MSGHSSGVQDIIVNAKKLPGEACSHRSSYRLVRPKSRLRDPSSLGLQQ